MTPQRKARIARFLNEEETSNDVYQTLLANFLRDRKGDVYQLAAAKLAIDFLREAWKEMEKCKVQEDASVPKGQPGL